MNSKDQHRQSQAEYGDVGSKALREQGLVSMHARRFLDIVAASCAIFLNFPLFLIVALLIKLESPGPILYKVRRIGKNGEIIYLHKFRTMRSDHSGLLGNVAQSIREDPRVTRVGAILRRTSIDELPQLVNVLLGDITLVGPKPLPLPDAEFFQSKALESDSRVTLWWNARSLVEPGMVTPTGILARNASVTPDGLLAVELEYLQTRSLFGDLKLLFLGILSGFKSRGAY
ncbi:sugar transferase [Rhizobium leguminosarum]|uniref:sugar transferase n=1 Tax=Rhizobium leguminosarum TaxID=384 RepID=UPI001C952F9F|nr:sugar transferase [Rhizobium leguminosarum]MBY5442811.1 sugar transferase [Rhizobium leguminosarum]